MTPALIMGVRESFVASSYPISFLIPSRSGAPCPTIPIFSVFTAGTSCEELHEAPQVACRLDSALLLRRFAGRRNHRRASLIFALYITNVRAWRERKDPAACP